MSLVTFPFFSRFWLNMCNGLICILIISRKYIYYLFISSGFSGMSQLTICLMVNGLVRTLIYIQTFVLKLKVGGGIDPLFVTERCSWKRVERSGGSILNLTTLLWFVKVHINNVFVLDWLWSKYLRRFLLPSFHLLLLSLSLHYSCCSSLFFLGLVLKFIKRYN
jgi:hypothetical protein